MLALECPVAYAFVPGLCLFSLPVVSSAATVGIYVHTAESLIFSPSDCLQSPGLTQPWKKQSGREGEFIFPGQPMCDGMSGQLSLRVTIWTYFPD